MRTAGPLLAMFNWEFISVMTSMSVMVLAVANTMGSVLPGLGRLWSAFIASLILTVYAAVKGGWSWQPARVVEVLVFAFILFSISAGANQSVIAIGKRMRRDAGRGAEGPGPSDARRGGREGWWASWF